MLAFQIESRGAAPTLAQVAKPTPGQGEVLIRIAACGLNFADRLMVSGDYQDIPEPPFTLGMELAGTVEAVGDGVRGIGTGDRVAVFAGSGGLAEYGVFDAGRCVAIPDGMSMHEAAGFQVAYGTSHLALTKRARLQPGELLVVLGAAGGVGLTAVELGKALGARVAAVARGPEKLAVAGAAGADHLIDSDSQDIRAEIKALGGLDVLYDPVGGDQFGQAMRAARPQARLVVIGFASGDVPPVPANILLVKNIDVIGFYWGGYLKFSPVTLYESLADLFAMHARAQLRPHISHVLPLSGAEEAIRLLSSRKATGKIVVTMANAAGGPG